MIARHIRGVYCGRADRVKDLLARGVDANGSFGGKTPNEAAAIASREEVAEVLRAAGPETDFLSAVVLGDDGRVRELRSAGADPNHRSENGQPVLGLAAERGHRHVVLALLEHRAEFNGADNAGNTPLRSAASRRDPELVRLLLDRDANVGLVEQVALGDRSAFTAHLDSGADLDAEISKGHTLLTAAILGRQLELVRELLRALREANRRLQRSDTGNPG